MLCLLEIRAAGLFRILAQLMCSDTELKPSKLVMWVHTEPSTSFWIKY